MSNRRYIQIFFTVFIGLLLLIGTGNYFIDPYGLHFHHRAEGINKHKPAFLKYARVIKLFNADIISPEALFLGNSRILYLAPEDAFRKYHDYRYYNFSLSSGTANEMDELLAYSIRNYDIRSVCYGVDFIAMSSWGGRYAYTFDLELVRGEKSKFLELVKMQTSTNAIQESYECLKANMNDPEGRKVMFHYNQFGSRTNKWREIVYADLGDDWLDDEIEKVMKTYTDIYYDTNLHIPEHRKDAYLSILEQCHENDISYMAFINPLYCDQFELLIASHSYDAYTEFLHFLAENGGIWYFGGNNEITSDKNYFWDAQHPRKALGDILAGIMFSEADSLYTSPLFGTFYTDENIDLLIDRLDLERMRLLGGVGSLVERETP